MSLTRQRLRTPAAAAGLELQKGVGVSSTHTPAAAWLTEALVVCFCGGAVCVSFLSSSVPAEETPAATRRLWAEASSSATMQQLEAHHLQVQKVPGRHALCSGRLPGCL